MAEAAAKVALQPSETVVKTAAVSIWEIFLEFLIIGASSFGGVVPYLRGSLVTKRDWVDDKEFVEMLSISQSLPGLNATNMAVVVGEKLRGWMGSVAAIVGICLPGGLLMFAVGMFYRSHGDHDFVTAGLKKDGGGSSWPDPVHGGEPRQEVAFRQTREPAPESRSQGCTLFLFLARPMEPSALRYTDGSTAGR